MRALLEPLRAAGAKPPHVARLLRVWLGGGRLGPECSTESLPFPAAVLELLPELDAELERLAAIESAHPAGDGAARLLVRLGDGRSVESVLLPRGGLCVSTQVGCAVGCTFCTTGLGGLERQLASLEILAQLALARRRRTVRRVVLMGMGEPTHNLPAVLAAIEHMGREGGLGHKEIVFSTVGERRALDALAAAEVKPALALSLHSTSFERRTALLPRAPRLDPRELVELADAYSRRAGHPLQLQWTLLAGVNDGDDELEQLVDWLRGRRVVVDFIPFNPGPGLDHARTSRERAHVLTRTLHRHGIHAKLRRSAAAEVDGACGQLRARRLPA